MLRVTFLFVGLAVPNVLEAIKHLKEGIIKRVKIKESEPYETWNTQELEEVGKIGFVSKSFVEDE